MVGMEIDFVIVVGISLSGFGGDFDLEERGIGAGRQECRPCRLRFATPGHGRLALHCR